MSADVVAKLRDCLARAIGGTTVEHVGPDTHLFEEAVLDSVSTLQMVDEIQKTFSIQLKDEDLFSAAFTTLGGLSQLVLERQNA